MSLESQLTAWQRREWLARLAWGAARGLAVVAAGLVIACATDWFIDRTEDTPFPLRVALTVAQAVAAVLAAAVFLGRLGVPTLDALAGRAEEHNPAFGHRLVTALQLNRPAARTAGMSAALIAAVTREADELLAAHRLTAPPERPRVGPALAILVPLAVLFGGFAAWRPELATALLARQALLNVDIPRPVTVTNATPELWPTGDEVELRLHVTGPVGEDATGTAVVAPEGQPSAAFPLLPAGPTADGATLFTAKLPASSAPFRFRARVAGGRLRQPGAVRFEPRPSVIVEGLAAWVLLPLYVDPAGKRRYERFQSQGEVFAVADSAVRVEAPTFKEVVSGAVVLLTRDAAGQDREYGRVPLVVAPDGKSVSGRFDIPSRAAGYRVEVTDGNGFLNLNPPRVALLQEVLKDPREPGPLDDFEVNGMPLAVGGQVQIGYAAKSPLGLSRAAVSYRVNDGPWTFLPLARTDADVLKVGKYLPEMGVFHESGAFGQVEFYPLPATNPEQDPPGLEAGGRYNFQTAALQKPGPGGSAVKLEVGDRVEFLVEVYDRNPAAGRPPGRSESRIKTVVTDAQVQAWLDGRDQSRERLRQIEERQRGVFGRGK